MNKTIAFIRIKYAHKALTFYKENLKMKIDNEYFWEKPHKQAGLLAYAKGSWEGVEILFQELNEPEYHTASIYITFDLKITPEEKVLSYFDVLSKNAKKVMQPACWNKTKTFYGSLIDKFGVLWEFKAF